MSCASSNRYEPGPGASLRAAAVAALLVGLLLPPAWGDDGDAPTAEQALAGDGKALIALRNGGVGAVDTSSERWTRSRSEIERGC